jgi:hypothetical protein
MTAPEPEEFALEEYRQLKSEQKSRIGFRDNLLYANALAVAGALTLAGTAHNPGFLLLVPAVVTVLGWTYLSNDVMITAIGSYIRRHPVLSVMGWESEHPADTRRGERKLIQLAVDLAAFCGSSLAAIAAFWAAPHTQPVLVVIASCIELAAVLVLARQFIVYSPAPRIRVRARLPRKEVRS